MPKMNPQVKSFLTGSQAYGIPTKSSDIDLVVFLDNKDYYKLSDLADVYAPSNHPSASDEEARPSLRFGKLNIVPCFEPELFQAWYDGTEFLKGEAPVTKQRAKEVLEEFRKRAKLKIKKRSKEERLAKAKPKPLSKSRS